jgi:hypothetical protein
VLAQHAGRFIIFSINANIYNKKPIGSTLKELFTATGKTKKFFCQVEMFDVCTTGDMAQIDTIISSCHTRINMGASIFFTASMIRAFRSARSRGNCGTNTRSLTLHEMRVAQYPLTYSCNIPTHKRIFPGVVSSSLNTLAKLRQNCEIR